MARTRTGWWVSEQCAKRVRGDAPGRGWARGSAAETRGGARRHHLHDRHPLLRMPRFLARTGWCVRKGRGEREPPCCVADGGWGARGCTNRRVMRTRWGRTARGGHLNVCPTPLCKRSKGGEGAETEGEGQPEGMALAYPVSHEWGGVETQGRGATEGTAALLRPRLRRRGSAGSKRGGGEHLRHVLHMPPHEWDGRGVSDGGTGKREGRTCTNTTAWSLSPCVCVAAVVETATAASNDGVMRPGGRGNE